MKFIYILLFLCLFGCDIKKEDNIKNATNNADTYFIITCLQTPGGVYKFIASRGYAGYYTYNHLLEEDETGIHLSKCNK